MFLTENIVGAQIAFLLRPISVIRQSLTLQSFKELPIIRKALSSHGKVFLLVQRSAGICFRETRMEDGGRGYFIK